jgi:hypothetical protein
MRSCGILLGRNILDLMRSCVDLGQRRSKGLCCRDEFLYLLECLMVAAPEPKVVNREQKIETHRPKKSRRE